ncbi:UDP-2,4-diacetamido-2,4,6-trideoxy-beta-L-altropyranose hydrolase [Zwartia vadi]|uniref:UDP-2,4-diacetamido-2,4, 6-trideoxy-beta-L-altropyranose hydrolase n=1 Tax=Zwartia vadi TaxID=3058168 RepID=UPI0025B4C233|nr:UDP-2,4-diacetamido-2,4,6-trideoxy-beta-L-altropyranose hydrolase [Zwartia vadi]MDN3988252.1 UDP-2,4-diacetamido-2,4,6-trideoxy-beta-L-altropyranose hydrolase [Zwartia vadi]
MTLGFCFRVDASLHIGTGHLMRCVTLAEALRQHGAHCHFICRNHPGHLLEFVRQCGFTLTALSTEPLISTVARGVDEDPSAPVHAEWLGCRWETDAEQTREVLSAIEPDWLVVDHYALDHRWEQALQSHYRKLMVIDDLADRPHQCDLLIDQNLGRQAADYKNLVPSDCKVLAGPRYALLRPEFSALRAYSLQRRLQRRQQPVLRNILITMGGVDKPNATSLVLQTLKHCKFPEDCRISVIMGQQAPWLLQVQALAQQIPWPTEVLVNINDMAQRMANSDLAIGAAGGTSWERCCLGLPAMMIVLADNQERGAHALQQAKAAYLIGRLEEVEMKLPIAINALLSSERLHDMSHAAAELTDGLGVDRVLTAMRACDD